MLKLKPDTLLIAAAAGVALWFVSRVATGKPLTIFGKATTTAPTSTGAARVNAVNTKQLQNNATKGQPGYGWQYFSDGSSIDPNGRYYGSNADVYNQQGILAADMGGTSW